MRRLWTLLGVLAIAALVGGFGQRAPVAALQPATSTVSHGANCPTPTIAQNAALVRAYWDQVYNAHDPARVAAFLADDFVRHDLSLPEASQPGVADDIARTAAQLADFPDLRIRIDDLVAAGDEVVARTTWSGTQLHPLAPWGAPATGRPTTFAVVSIVRIACGRFAEEWVLFDDLTMFRQLGIISDAELATVGTPGAVPQPAPAATPAATAPRPAGKPSIFIGSSVEGLPAAAALQQDLQYVADVTLWDQGPFHLSAGTLADLDRAGEQFDFAILVLSQDDIVVKRGQSLNVPRDNVIFELGFFMGRLGVDRTFIVYDRDAAPALPSDLAGVTAATYGERPDGNLEAALGPVAAALTRAMDDAMAVPTKPGP